MTLPRFSIVIPTKGRPETFEHALATALGQTEPAIQVVVQNNGADPATRAIVDRAADPRIVYDETADSLSMTENWARALGHAVGSYVTVLGDDDGLLPDACAYAGRLVDQAPDLKLVAWKPADYGWDSDRSHLRNRLVVRHIDDSEQADLIDSAGLVERLYAMTLSFLDLPMIYSAFVHQSVLQLARIRFGRYLASTLPDIHSGVVNLLLVGRYVRLNRPLSIRGTSGKSVGAAFSRRAEGADRRAAFEAENAGIGWHPDLFPSANLAMVVANALMGTAQALRRPDLRVDMAALVRLMAETVGHDPEGYDATLADVGRLAALHGVPLPEPPPRPPPRGPAPPGRWPDAGTTVLVVDAQAEGLGTVADAARRLRDLLPAWQ